MTLDEEIAMLEESLGAVTVAPDAVPEVSMDEEIEQLERQLNPPAQPRQEPLESESYWGDVASNALPSTARLVTDTVDAIVNYEDTGRAIKDLGLGMASKVGLGEHDESAVDAMGDFYAQRYGSMEGLQEAFRTDPAGIISDIAGVVSGGAGAVGKAAGLASNSSRMAKLSNLATNISQKAAMVDPVTAALKGSQLAAKGLNKMGVPERVMEGMIKPDIKTAPGAAKALTHADIPLSAGGVKKLNKATGGLNTQIDNIVSNVDELPPLASEVYTPSKEFANKYLNPLQSTKADKSMDAVIGMAKEFPKQFDSLEDLQSFKKNLYKDIDWKASKAKAKMKNDYLKDVASSARESIEDTARKAGYGDQIGELNRLEGDLINARSPLEKAVKRTQKRNPIGLTSMLAGIGSAGVFADPTLGLLSAGATQALFNPRAGSLYARKAAQFGNAGDTINNILPGLRLGLGISRNPGILEQFDEYLLGPQ